MKKLVFILAFCPISIFAQIFVNNKNISKDSSEYLTGFSTIVIDMKPASPTRATYYSVSDGEPDTTGSWVNKSKWVLQKSLKS